jgi:hypothetical protein
MSDVLQCPYCVLRFSTQSELDQHKAFDHPEVAEEEAPPAEEAATPIPPTEAPATEAEPEPKQKGGWFKRLFGGG